MRFVVSNPTSKRQISLKMRRFSTTFISLLGYLILCVHKIQGFEESIFEDEDIYRQALPPAIISGITAPGTKWCGPGNTASNYNDLGTQRDTDMCCRDHDNCEEILEPQTTLHGFNNTDWFPILKCSCEQKFINCLQAVDNVISNALGRLYYTARSKCFTQGHPIVRCKQHQEGTFRKRCIRYDIDKKKAKIWQFYDMPFFTVNIGSKLQGAPTKFLYVLLIHILSYYCNLK